MTTITALPTPPSRSDDADTFVTRADAFIAALPTFVSQTNTLAVQVTADAATASSAATSATASAAAAAASAGVAIWVSGTTYAIGDARWSPINYISYRRKTVGAGTTDPSADTTNWQPLNSVLIAGNRNKIINGNFAVNQRGNSGTVTLAAGAYGHDMFKAGASGCTYTFTTSGNDVVPTITSGSLMQVIEGTYIEGGVYTLSHAGTAQARIAVNGAATSGSYAAAPLASASATAGQNITVEFTTGTVSKVQLEAGTIATAFERRLNELQLCQRYGFPLLDNSVASETLGFGYSTSTTNTAILRQPPVELRALPTLIFLQGAASGLNSAAGGSALSAVAVSSTESTLRLLKLNVTGTGFTSGAATYIKNSGSTNIKLFAEAGL